MDPLKRFYSKLPVVEQEMARVVARDAPPAEVYGLIWEFLDRGGKRFRPMLCLASSRAVGGQDADALPAGAAIELFHNFTLIHDDIEDDSQLRRGQPCLHIAHGLPLALNAGDGLFMMVWRAALRVKSRHALAAQELLLGSFTAVLEGQAVELGWHRNNRWDIVEKDYLSMVGGKTAALIEASCRVGALLGGGTKRQQKALGSFGRSIGIAFQIQDDVLNLTGAEEKYQKEIGGDIREGKRTMMVLHALPKLSKVDADKMRSILGSQSAGQGEIEWCIAKMKSTGSIDYASRYARRLVEGALEDLKALPPSSAREELEAVAHYIISREK